MMRRFHENNNYCKDKISCFVQNQFIIREGDEERSGLWKSYKEWMKQNRPVFRLLEDSLSRVLLYVAPRGNGSSDGVEVGYAMLHVWSLLNDILVMGGDGLWGRSGNGMTVGNWNHDMVPLLRLGLSLLEHVAPAIEVVSRQKGADHDALLHIERFKLIFRTALLLYNYFNTNTNNNQPLQRSLLEDGGMLFLNGNYQLSTEEEQLHFDKLSYRGKRTGQPCVAAVSSSSSSSSQHTSQSEKDSTIFQNIFQKYRWILSDILHIIRPYYWTLACRNYHNSHHHPLQSVTALSQIKQDSSSINHHQHNNYPSFGLWKSYLLSLAMDLLSQKLAVAGAPIISPSTHHEILRRKRRLWLYMLRNPFWNTATFPIVSRFIQLIQSSTYPKILWRFVLQPIVDYAMDTLHYYQSHHFMLE